MLGIEGQELSLKGIKFSFVSTLFYWVSLYEFRRSAIVIFWNLYVDVFAL
jgi:hypothetical protein